MPKSSQVNVIFRNVFIVAFVLQAVKMTIFLPDGEMWANQIRFFLTGNPSMFDFRAAYGHPGTTFLSLGCLMHFSGLSYYAAITLSVAFLVAAATAGCSALCFLLQPRSLWWFTTAFILTASRFYMLATPPTAVIMPLLVLLVLSLCWCWDHTVSGWFYVLFGIGLGLSAATRLDMSLFTGIPLLILLYYRKGKSMVAPVLSGAVISFFIADPFLWFMPVQHIFDLLSKFTMHYADYEVARQVPWFEWVQGVPLAIIAIAWFLVLHIRRRLDCIVPAPVLFVFLGISLLAVLLLISSRFQSIRYLYPLIVVWEIFLPLFALQGSLQCEDSVSWSADGLDTRSAWVIMGFVLPTQMLEYLFMFHG